MPVQFGPGEWSISPGQIPGDGSACPIPLVGKEAVAPRKLSGHRSDPICVRHGPLMDNQFFKGERHDCFGVESRPQEVFRLSGSHSFVSALLCSTFYSLNAPAPFCPSAKMGVHIRDHGLTHNDTGAAATRQDIALDAYYPKVIISTCGRLSLRVISAVTKPATNDSTNT